MRIEAVANWAATDCCIVVTVCKAPLHSVCLQYINYTAVKDQWGAYV